VNWTRITHRYMINTLIYKKKLSDLIWKSYILTDSLKDEDLLQSFVQRKGVKEL